MGIPVSRLQNEINSREFAMYVAYYRVEPFGQERSDLSAAIICNTMSRLHGVKSTKISDFMPSYESKQAQAQTKTPAQMFNMFVQMTKRVGGKVIDRNAVEGGK